MNRRHFLKTSTAAGAALGGFSIFGVEVSSRTGKTALLGCGWWGNNILREAMGSGACRITALCDATNGNSIHG